MLISVFVQGLILAGLGGTICAAEDGTGVSSVQGKIFLFLFLFLPD